jgi:plasmid stability protein
MAKLEISDELYGKLAKRARVHGHTVEEEAAELLRDMHVRLDREEHSKLLAEIRALPKIKSDLDPVALIREDRDTR